MKIKHWDHIGFDSSKYLSESPHTCMYLSQGPLIDRYRAKIDDSTLMFSNGQWDLCAIRGGVGEGCVDGIACGLHIEYQRVRLVLDAALKIKIVVLFVSSSEWDSYRYPEKECKINIYTCIWTTLTYILWTMSIGNWEHHWYAIKVMYISMSLNMLTQGTYLVFGCMVPVIGSTTSWTERPSQWQLFSSNENL